MWDAAPVHDIRKPKPNKQLAFGEFFSLEGSYNVEHFNVCLVRKAQIFAASGVNSGN